MKDYIMVIDDSPTIRTSVELVLKGFGYPIRQAENGLDALNKISCIRDEGDDVKMCVVDINMPEMDGLTFIKEFRKNDRFVPIVVLTTEADQAKISAGKDLGASGWLLKPFKVDELTGVVSRFIRQEVSA
jgi:two-component system chemotaxis response regulator CheY